MNHELIMDESNKTAITSIAQLLGSLILLGKKKDNVSEPDVACQMN